MNDCLLEERKGQVMENQQYKSFLEYNGSMESNIESHAVQDHYTPFIHDEENHIESSYEEDEFENYTGEPSTNRMERGIISQEKTVEEIEEEIS